MLDTITRMQLTVEELGYNYNGYGLDDYKVMIALLDNGYYDSIEDMLDNYDNIVVYWNDSLESLAEEFVNEGLFGDVSDSIINYIDYKSIANDLQYDYDVVNVEGETFIIQVP